MKDLTDIIKVNAQCAPDNPAFMSSKGTEISYIQVLNAVENYALSFRNSGRGRAGVLADNSPEWFYAVCASFSENPVTALIDPQLDAENTISALQRTGLEIIYYDANSEDTVMVLKEKMPELKLIPIPEPDFSKCSEDISLSSLGNYYIVFTSGTTKKSKAAVTRIESFAGRLAQSAGYYSHIDGGKVMNPLPWHHAYAHLLLFAYYMNRVPIVVSSMKRIVPDIRKFRPETLCLVPKVISFLNERDIFNKYGIKMIQTGGGSPSSKDIDRLMTDGIAVQNCYGSTEMSGGVLLNEAGKAPTLLRTFPGDEAFTDENGELIIKTSFHLDEYYNDPESTAELLSGDTIHTGDMAFIR